jgi:SAM-dependent methyltransferase
MSIGAARHSLTFKIVSVAIACSVAFNDMAFAAERTAEAGNVPTLSPISRFILGDDALIDRAEKSSSEISHLFKDDAAIVYASQLIGQALETAESAQNISEKALRALLKKHLGHMGGLSFDWPALIKDDQTFCLPIRGNDISQRRVLRYYLPSDNPAAAEGKSSISVGPGETRLICEKIFFVPPAERAIKLLLPAAAEDLLAGEKEAAPAITADLDPATTSMPYEINYGPEFREVLASLGEYGSQGTFERAVEYEAWQLFHENPWQSLLYALSVYASDTPTNDLTMFQSFLWKYADKIGEAEKEAIKEAFDLLVEQVRAASMVLPLEIDETMGGTKYIDLTGSKYIGDIGDEEARDIVHAFLSLRSAHVERIDAAIGVVESAVPEIEVLRDALVYYRGRVNDFFDELGEKTKRLEGKEPDVFGAAGLTALLPAAFINGQGVFVFAILTYGFFIYWHTSLRPHFRANAPKTFAEAARTAAQKICQDLKSLFFPFPARETIREEERSERAGDKQYVQKTEGPDAYLSKPVFLPTPPEFRRVKDEKSVERLKNFIEAIKIGKYQQGRKVDLRGISADTEIIIVGDLHERLDNLRKILGHRKTETVMGQDTQGDTVLAKVKKGKAVLVILGDAIHADENIASPQALSMERSLEMMENIMALKVQNPDNVYYVLGNHDDPDVDCAKLVKDPVTGIRKPVRQGMMYKDKIRTVYGEAYLDLYREFVRVSPLRVLADGLAAMHAGPPKGLTLRQIKAIEYEDVIRDFEKTEMSSATMIWGRYQGSIVKEDIKKAFGALIEASGFSSHDIDRYLKAIRQPKAFFVVAHSPHMIPRGRFHVEFEKDRFVIYGARDVTGYFSHKGGTIEVVDVSREKPVVVYAHAESEKGGKRRANWAARARNILGISAFLAGGLPLMLSAVRAVEAQSAFNAAQDGFYGIFAVTAALLGMTYGVKYRQEYDEATFMEAFRRMRSSDEYIRMAGARDIAGMPVPEGFDFYDRRIRNIEELLTHVLFLELNEYVRAAAARYLARFGAQYPLKEATWRRMLEILSGSETPENIRKEVMNVFSEAAFVYSGFLLEAYRTAFALLISTADPSARVMAVRMIGNLVRLPSTQSYPEVFEAFNKLEEIAGTGAIRYPVYTWAGPYEAQHVFEEDQVQVEALEYLHTIFARAVHFLDLSLNLKHQDPEALTLEITDASRHFLFKEIELAASSDPEELWVGIQELFDKICLRLLSTIRKESGKSKDARFHAAKTFSKITRSWSDFLRRRSVFPDTAMAVFLSWEHLGSFIEDRVYSVTYGKKLNIPESDPGVAMLLAETFTGFAKEEKMPEIKKAAESLTASVFDRDPRVSARAENIILALDRKFPMAGRDRSFKKLVEFISSRSEKEAGLGGKIFSVLPWLVLAGGVAFSIFSGQQIASAYAAAGLMGLGITLSSDSSGHGSGMRSSLGYMLSAAARSVVTAGKNEDITMEAESRLQSCSVDYLTDPDNVDLTVQSEDLPHVYLLMDRMVSGKLSSADISPIKIHVHEDGSVKIWDGKHRLEALKRLGVSFAPAHVTYVKKDLIGRYPFEDISYGFEGGTGASGLKKAGTKVTVLDIDIMKKAEKESNTEEVTRIQSMIGLQEAFAGSEEKWGIYAPTPVIIALNILFYIKSIKPDARICDIGSGIGRFCFVAGTAPSLRFPFVAGIEARERLHFEAMEYKKKIAEFDGADNIALINGDFFKEDLTSYDFLYFFFTHPSEEKIDSFNRRLYEKMISPTGLKPGAKFIMWGNFEDISDDRALFGERVKMGRHDFSVYTRAGKESPRDDSPGAIRLLPLVATAIAAVTAAIAVYFMKVGPGNILGAFAAVSLGAILPSLDIFEPEFTESSAGPLLKQLDSEDEIARMAAAKRLSGLRMSGKIGIKEPFAVYAETMAEKIIFSKEPDEVKQDILSFVKNFRAAYPSQYMMDESLLDFLAEPEESEAVKQDALKALSRGRTIDGEIAAKAYLAFTHLLLSAKDEITRVMCVKALGKLFSYPDDRNNVLNRRIFSVLEEMAEFGRISYALDLDSDVPDGVMTVGEAAREQAIISIAGIHVGEIKFIERSFRQGGRLGTDDLAKVLSENFRNRYGLFAYLLSGEEEFVRPLRVRLAAAQAVRKITEAWQDLFITYSVDIAPGSAAERYMAEMRRFIVAGIYQVVYGNNPRRIDRDLRVRLMVSDLLAEYGIPDSLSGGVLLRAVQPMVFDQDDEIAAHAEKLVLNIGRKDSDLKSDPNAMRLLKLCGESFKKRQGWDVLGTIGLFTAIVIGTNLMRFFGYESPVFLIEGWEILPVALGMLGMSLDKNAKVSEYKWPVAGDDPSAKNPYGREENVSRRFSDLDYQYLGDITQELSDRTDPYHGKKQKEPPAKILLIGVGRGLEAFDLFYQYGNRVEITATAKEDLLYRTPEEVLENGLYPLSREEAAGYIERIRERYIRCDLDEGIDLADNSFDMVIIDEFTLGYVKDKWAAVKEMLRVCNVGGVVYFSPKQGHIRLGEKDLTFGQYFAEIEYPDVDSLSISDAGPIERNKRNSEWMKITKKTVMALPGLKLEEARSRIPTVRGRPIDVLLWDSYYVPEELSGVRSGEGKSVKEGVRVGSESKRVDVRSSILEAVLPYGEDARFDISIDIEDAMPAIDADAEEISSLWANLLTNAADSILGSAVPPSKGKISITGRSVEKEGQRLIEMTFTDNGEGAPASFPKTGPISDEDKNTGAPGSIEALRAARSIVEKMGGSMDVASLAREQYENMKLDSALAISFSEEEKDTIRAFYPDIARFIARTIGVISFAGTEEALRGEDREDVIENLGTKRFFKQLVNDVEASGRDRSTVRPLAHILNNIMNPVGISFSIMHEEMEAGTMDEKTRAEGLLSLSEGKDNLRRALTLFLRISRNEFFEHPASAVTARIPVEAAAKPDAALSREVAGDFIDTVMIRQIETKMPDGNTIFILSTSWIKQYGKENLEYRDINQLLSAIRGFCRSRGITFVVSEDDKVVSDIKKETSQKGNLNAKVIVLAGEDKVRSAEFEIFRKDSNVFVAGVSGESARILELVILAMKLAFGQDTDNIDWAKDITFENDPQYPNMFIFSLPAADPIDWTDPVRIYQMEREVLIKA